jgi:hypothetical protein
LVPTEPQAASTEVNNTAAIRADERTEER